MSSLQRGVLLTAQTDRSECESYIRFLARPDSYVHRMYPDRVRGFTIESKDHGDGETLYLLYPLLASR